MVCLGATESGESYINLISISREVQNYVRHVVIALSVPTTILHQNEDYPDPEMNLPFVGAETVWPDPV